MFFFHTMRTEDNAFNTGKGPLADQYELEDRRDYCRSVKSCKLSFSD